MGSKFWSATWMWSPRTRFFIGTNPRSIVCTRADPGKQNLGNRLHESEVAADGAVDTEGHEEGKPDGNTEGVNATAMSVGRHEGMRDTNKADGEGEGICAFSFSEVAVYRPLLNR
mmetsp:Transcript_24485/g.41624  ORF Transcript_24485/g.41624 Transcript_24485/m.41624 type:complete len:115 (-) Transcript_24485:394-738(-)